MSKDILNIDTITVNTGDQSEIYDKIEKYFDFIQRTIDANYENLLSDNSNLSNSLLHPCFDRERDCLIPTGWVVEKRLQGRGLDDYIHTLYYKGNVVALVIERRDLSNYVQFTFFNRLEEILSE